MSDLQLTIKDETLYLLPERAVYWERTGTLFISDLHLGKSPKGASCSIRASMSHSRIDLMRLTIALNRTAADKLIILGDVIHRKVGWENPTLQRLAIAWRTQHPDLPIILIRGNHDRRAGDPPQELNIRCVDGPTPGPVFVLQHEPQPVYDADAYALSGHLHPNILFGGVEESGVKIRCFWFQPNLAVLPAFGETTGQGVITPHDGDQVFLIEDGKVVPHHPT